MTPFLSTRAALAAASLTIALALAGPAQAADAPFVLAQSTVHKLKVFADGGAGWCAAHLKLRMVLDADSPDAGNPTAQLDMLNRLKTPIGTDCARAADAEIAVLTANKPEGTYRATKAEGWVFASTTAGTAAAKQPASLDTPDEQGAAALAKPATTAAAAAAPPATQPGDVPGSHDPAFLKRYAGSKIIAYASRPYDQYIFLADNEQKKKTVEGAITRLVYRVDVGHTCLEILRNYEQAVKDAGLEIAAEVLPCSGEYGRIGLEDMAWSQTPMPQIQRNPYSWGCPTNCGPDGPMAYFSAHGIKDGQDITLSVISLEKHHELTLASAAKPPITLAEGEILVGVDIVTAKAVDINMVTVKASDMADALAATGMVDLYGILFDVDKSDIKPESVKTLDEVASLMKIDRGLKLEISGHTDNTGDKDHNQKLSEGRAQAVVDALVKNYAIDAARLEAKGYGDTKPIADNATDAGKAKNRRVELRKI